MSAYLSAVTDPKTMLALVGAAYVTLNVARFLGFMYGRTSTKVNLKKYKKLPNGQTPWAIVTGASDGIGKQFALEIAKQKFNVVVMARTKSKLEAVAAECKKNGSAEVLVIPFDFSAVTVSDYQQGLKKQLVDAKILDNVTILVNNVGIANDYCEPFEVQDPEWDSKIIKVNCESQVQMTKLILPTMKKNNCGGIVGLSSFSAETNPPYLSVYGATKSFNRAFSIAIASELRNTKVDSFCVKPSFVCTAMSGIKKVTFSNVAAEPTVQYTLSQLPNTKSLLGGRETSGHLNHNIISGFMASLPKFQMYKTVSQAMVGAVKRHAKKKAAKEAETKKAQ